MITQNSKSSMPFNPIHAVLDNLKLVLAIAAAGILFIVAFVTLTSKPYYTVSASLLFEPKIPELLYNNQDRYLHSFEDWMRTQSHEIESNGVLERAIQSYEDSGFVWIREGESLKTAVDRLRARMNIRQINNTQIMTIEMGSGRQNGLAELVNAVNDQYILHKDRQRKEQDQKKLDYLQSEKIKYNEKLEEAYQELMDISRGYGTAIADEKNLYIYLDMFIDLRTRYNQVLTRRIETENRLSALENQKSRLDSLNIYDQRNTQSLLELEQEIDAKMLGWKPGSELYRDYESMLSQIDSSSIRTARKFLVSAIVEEINDQQMAYEAAVQTENDLKREMRKAQRELMDINTAVLKTSTQRQAIERIIQTWDRINTRIEQIEIELFNPGRVRVLSAAQRPEFPDPSKTNKKLFLGIVAVIGMALGTAAARELLDKRIKRPADVERVLGFPATGFLLDAAAEEIPAEELDAVYQHHGNSYLTELYNQLAVKIEREHDEFDAQTFTLFSLKGKSGVSSAARNMLAMLDADRHEKILVDLNASPQYSSEDGLIAWLAANRKLENGIIRDVNAYFDVLPLGSLRELDIARIRPSAVRELMQRLKKNYKYIFIDGPPMLLSSEAQTIAQASDVTMLVVDSQKDIWPELSRAIHMLDKLKIKVVSIILNKVQIKRAGYLRKLMDIHRVNHEPLSHAADKKTEKKQAA